MPMPPLRHDADTASSVDDLRARIAALEEQIRAVIQILKAMKGDQ